jgi:hypothetical protein
MLRNSTLKESTVRVIYGLESLLRSTITSLLLSEQYTRHKLRDPVMIGSPRTEVASSLAYKLRTSRGSEWKLLITAPISYLPRLHTEQTPPLFASE